MHGPGDHDGLFESIGLSPIAMVLTNPNRHDNPVEIVNESFCRLTGYGESEILGRNCRFLSGQQTDPRATEQLRAAIAGRRSVATEILNYRRNGTTFFNAIMITPLYDADGRLAWFLGSQVDLGIQSQDALALRRSAAAARVAKLPVRQRQVLQSMARGLLNKQIAWNLKISEKTVKMHRARLIGRLGVATSAEAIRLAVEAGL